MHTLKPEPFRCRCGCLASEHDEDGACRGTCGACLEYRTPGDDVLSCVQRLASPSPRWEDALRQAHLPPDVPWVRWTHAIARFLLSHGIDVTLQPERGGRNGTHR